MNDEKRNPEDVEGTPDTDTPDTNTDDEIGSLEIDGPELQEAIPAAEAAVAPEPAPPPVAAPAAPRVFPQHYSILFASVMVLVGASSVWERAHIFGVEIRGPDMISGAFLLTVALYTVIVSVLNVIQGRLRGMLAAFVTGVTAIYLAIHNWLDTRAAEGFRGWSDIAKQEGASAQDRIGLFVSQFSPGMWLTLVGGALIVLVFLKAIFGGGGRKESAPAPSARRRGRR